MLALPADKFDQDMNGGWRPLADKPACLKVAADLLAAYRKANWGKLKPYQLHTNYWHEGQIRAAAGDYSTAAVLLMAGTGPTSGEGFDEYALGTVAFLKHDLPALKSARERLAKTPPPSDWKQQAATFKAKFGETMTWPLNLEILDGLIACFDKPYAEAYGEKCQPKNAD